MFVTSFLAPILNLHSGTISRAGWSQSVGTSLAYSHSYRIGRSTNAYFFHDLCTGTSPARVRHSLRIHHCSVSVFQMCRPLSTLDFCGSVADSMYLSTDHYLAYPFWAAVPPLPFTRAAHQQITTKSRPRHRKINRLIREAKQREHCSRNDLAYHSLHLFAHAHPTPFAKRAAMGHNIIVHMVHDKQ